MGEGGRGGQANLWGEGNLGRHRHSRRHVRQLWWHNKVGKEGMGHTQEKGRQEETWGGGRAGRKVEGKGEQ